ncbi:hypothetical protein ACIQUG_05560 [Ensifer sp. NPDC090286]|uniref:hypothetical protein n=1 Tax=Ensifer sp. NPDC090286 TaxID=3363991 RepID=UPI00383AC985
MNSYVRFALASLFALAMHSASLAKVPCEDTLKDVRSARSAATLSTTDAVKVDELINKGIDRCNADDDDRANGLFKQAMTAMGK